MPVPRAPLLRSRRSLRRRRSCCEPLTAREESARFKALQLRGDCGPPGFNLDLWADIVDESIEDPSKLPAPEVIAEEIVEQLEGALADFKLLAATLAAGKTDGDEDPDADLAAALAE